MLHKKTNPFNKLNPINSHIPTPRSKQHFVCCVITVRWHHIICNMTPLKMLPVFPQSNCLGMGDVELHQWVYLMHCHLRAVQAHHFSRGNLSTEYGFYQVVLGWEWVPHLVL